MISAITIIDNFIFTVISMLRALPSYSNFTTTAKPHTVILRGERLDHRRDYLGMIIRNDLKDDGDILRHLRNCYAWSSSIIRKFHHCSVGVKLHLCHAYCFTTYCCQLWINFNKDSYLKGKVTYNNMHRRIWGYSRLDSSGGMFTKNAIDTFDVLLRKNIYGLKEKIIF